MSEQSPSPEPQEVNGVCVARRLRGPEAYLLRTCLEREGIQVRIGNEHLASAELPAPESDLQLWVPEPDAERARALLDEARRAPEETGTRTCPQCGEANPAHFGACWQCQAPLGDTEPAPKPE
jgi:hypothetical protein